jgi:hypothetical protein
LPFSRFSAQDVATQAMERGIVASISDATVWRWLHADAIRPWRHRSWIFPRDPDFEMKAGRVLDLYHGLWQGLPVGSDDCVLNAYEKTSIQARCRTHATYGPRAGAPMLVEHEYARAGALVYLAAWDVRRAQLYGRCEPRSGIASFDRLVADVMTREPYPSASRVFWVVDNGSSHPGEKPGASPAAGRTSFSFTCPSMSAGSTRWRSISQFSNVGCSLRTTSTRSLRWRTASWQSRSDIRRRPAISMEVDAGGSLNSKLLAKLALQQAT